MTAGPAADPSGGSAFASRGSRRIHFTTLGEGPAVLLLPGIGSGSRLFGTLPRRFARAGCRCLALDPVGVPPSSPHQGDYDFGAAADDVLAVLDQAQLPRAHLVGTSFGGKVATVAGARFPERVASVVLLAAAAVVNARARRVHRFFEIVAEQLPPETLGEVLAPFLFGRTFLAAHPQTVDDIVRALRPDAERRALMVAQARALQTFDGEPFARALRLPALCIAGAEDTLTTAAEVRATAELVETSRYLELPDAGHSLLLESPRAFEAVVGFVRDADRGPGGRPEASR